MCTVANTEFTVLDSQGQTIVVGLFQGSTAGYLMGGNNGSRYTEISKLLFSNDTISTLGAVLVHGCNHAGGVMNSLKGYQGGGYIPSATITNEIKTLVFSNESSSVLAAVLNNAADASTGASSANKGYFFTDNTTSGTSICDLTFSNETTSLNGTSLSTSRARPFGITATIKGYCLGSQASDTSGNSAVIEAVAFANDAISTLSTTLSVSKGSGAGTSSLLAGYSIGGTGYTKVVEKLVFATEVNSSLGSILNQGGAGRLSDNSGASSTLNGYCMGGLVAAVSNTVDGVDFTNDTRHAVSATLNTARQSGCGVHI